MMLWVLSSIVLTSLAVIPFLIPGLFATTWWWGAIAATVIPSALLVNYTRGIALGIDQIKTFAKISWIADPIKLALVIALGLFAGFSDPEHGWLRILAAAIASTLIGIYCLRFISRHAKLGLAFDGPLLRSIVKRGVIFAMGGVLMRLNYRIDLLLLGLTYYAIPKEDISMYAIGASLAQFVWQIPIGLGYVIISRGVRTQNPALFAKKNARLVRLATIASIFVGGALCAVAPFLLPLIYRNSPSPNTIYIYIWILMPGIIAFIAARLFEADLIAKNHPWSINIVMIPVVLANIALNLYLIPQDWYFGGARGAALASTITYTLGAIGMTLMYSKKTGLSLAEIVIPRASDFRRAA